MAATGSLLLPAVGTLPLAARWIGPARAATGVGPGRRARVSRRPYVDFCAVAQLVGAIDDDTVAHRKPGTNLDTVTIGDAELDLADRYGAVVIDEIDEGAGNPALNARRRHHHDILVGIDQEPDIHELVGIERAGIVLE